MNLSLLLRGDAFLFEGNRLRLRLLVVPGSVRERHTTLVEYNNVLYNCLR